MNLSLQKTNSRTQVMIDGLATTLSEKSLSMLAKLAFGDNLNELRLTPGAELFTNSELAFIADLDNNLPKESHLQDRTVLILKATRLCNLRCTYCNSWRDGPGQVMPFEIMARVLHESLKTPNLTSLEIVWHGGEVTLLEPSYVERALWLQEKFRRPDTTVSNTIQTNATRLTPEWLDLLKKYKIGVGVSIDGPPEIHDARRITKNGEGSWLKVKSGIERLQEAEIPFAALAVVDECAISLGAENYLSYLANLDVKLVGLLNALPPNSEKSTNPTAYLNWYRFESFLVDLFRVWWNSYREKFVIRELEALVDSIRTGRPKLCIYADNCMGRYLTIEPNGTVSACDRYVGDPQYNFGSLLDGGLNHILKSSDKLKMAASIVDQQKRGVETCEFFRYCHGGCPHDSQLNLAHLQSFAKSGCCGLKDLLKEMIKIVS